MPGCRLHIMSVALTLPWGTERRWVEDDVPLRQLESVGVVRTGGMQHFTRHSIDDSHARSPSQQGGVIIRRLRDQLPTALWILTVQMFGARIAGAWHVPAQHAMHLRDLHTLRCHSSTDEGGVKKKGRRMNMRRVE